MNQFDEYKEFVRNILKRISMLPTKQLTICMQRKFPDLREEDVVAIFKELENKNILYVSKDLWAISRARYAREFDDSFFDNVDRRSYININENLANLCTGWDKDIVDCFWFISDMMPDSESFLVWNAPWHFQYITTPSENENSKIFEVTRITEKNRIALVQMIRDTSIDVPKVYQNEINRIAILDNKNQINYIPKLGFRCFAVLDEKQESGFKIVGMRSAEEAWDDCFGK